MNPPQKLEDAAVVFLVALFLYLAQRLQTTKTNKKVEEVSKKVEETKETADHVKTSISENNGGSSVKDHFDRIIRSQDLMAQRLERIEVNQDRQDAKIDAVDKKINDHIHEGLSRIVKRKKYRDQ